MRRWCIALAAVLAVLAQVPAASAEWFADAYLGPAVTSSSTLTFTTFGEERKEKVGGRSSALFGLRFGRWLDDVPWFGLAVDASYFRPAPDVQTVPLSLLVMVRYGFLKDEEFTRGRLQPYVGVGPSLFIMGRQGLRRLGAGQHDLRYASRHLRHGLPLLRTWGAPKWPPNPPSAPRVPGNP